MPGLQEWIHALEEGGGAKITRVFLAVLGFVAVASVYDYFCFKNFNTPEAMDSAQLARNLSEGKGYTTDFVRPFSIYLLREHNKDHNPMLKGAHPDLANAPVYPTILAGFFKVAPVKFQIQRKAAFSSYQPERWTAALNQILFFVAALLVFFLARRLFNPTVGWISAIVLAGTELLWHFTVSGLSTILLLVLVLGTAFCLVCLDEAQRKDALSPKKLLGFSLLAGVLIGLAGLTRYSFLWLIVPALVCTGLFASKYRFKTSFMILLAFLVITIPWMVRNESVSGTLFGTAGYAALDQTPEFPSDTLERSLSPELDKVTIKNLGNKLFTNLRDIVENPVRKFGGSWVFAFFLAGLLMRMRNPSAGHLRIFLGSALLVFLVVQAMSKTHLSDSGHDIDSENLLIVFAPLILIFGAAVFSALVEQLRLVDRAMASLLFVLFIAVVSAPLLFAVLPPRGYASAYPPYHPTLIQGLGEDMKPSELMMSDIPWAVAWYGGRQCVEITLDRDKDFFAINDDMKPVQALYLSPNTTDGRFLSQIVKGKSWGQLAFQVTARGPDALVGFPMKSVRSDLLPQHLFLADWERWKMPKD